MTDAPVRPDVPLVSIIVPAHNEETRIGDVVKALSQLPLRMEILVVDDASSDHTASRVPRSGFVRLIHLATRRGRAGALLEGFRQAGGDIVVTHDGDGEYPPSAVASMVKALLEREGAVFGNRFTRGRPPGMTRLYYAGNIFLSSWFNLLLGTRIQDLETGSKAFSRKFLQAVLDDPLMAQGPCGCPQLGAAVLSQGGTLREVPIEYEARSASLKKIRWPDGFHQALICLKLCARRLGILSFAALTVLSLGSCVRAPEPQRARPKLFHSLELIRVIENAGKTGGPFREPSMVRAMGDGAFIVADSLRHRVVLMGLDGGFRGAVGRYGEGPESFDTPRSLFARPWKAPLMLLPPGVSSMAGEADLRALLRPYGGPLVWVCDNAGKLRVLTGDLRTLITGLGFGPKEPGPWSADMGPAGDLVILERNGVVSRYQIDEIGDPPLKPAKVLAQFGGPGRYPGRFRDPLQVRVLNDESVLVLDTGHGLIQRFKEDGTFMNSVGRPGYGGGGLVAPCDASVDGQGRLWVADLLSPLLEVFLPSGPYLFSVDPRSAAGAGTHPSSVSIDKNENILLADRYRHRVLVMREAPEGGGAR